MVCNEIRCVGITHLRVEGVSPFSEGCMPTNICGRLGLDCIHVSLTVDRKAVNLSQLIRKTLSSHYHNLLCNIKILLNYVFWVALK